MSTFSVEGQASLENDRIIGDYLDSLFSTPMPVQVFKNRYELQRTINLEEILGGQRIPSQYEAVLIVLITLRISRQLPENTRMQRVVVGAASSVVAYLKRNSVA